MNTGGVIIGFIAVSDSDLVEIKPIRNPRQIDAHKYSDGVLVGRVTGIMGEKCTPKFERGKMVVLDGDTHMYVSGTASIVGEKTLHPMMWKSRPSRPLKIFLSFSPVKTRQSWVFILI